MTARLDHNASSPAGMKTLGGVHAYVGQCGLPATLIDLVYLRVSQINGCAYCLDLHTRDLIKAGVPAEKLTLVGVWREAASLFTTQEQAALAWAESVTRVAETGVSERDFTEAANVFSAKELTDLTIAVGLMNAYNRIAISFRAVPQAAKSAA